MRNTMMVLGAVALGSAGAGANAGAGTGTTADAKAEPAGTKASRLGSRLFLDEHVLGPGQVTIEAAAAAHARDLATQGKHGVAFRAYWVDAHSGTIRCLVEAPSAEAVNHVHQEAHGLLAGKIVPVSGDNLDWSPAPGRKLYLDVHHLGPGKVTPEALAGAHAKDLAAQGKHGVRYLNYWFDAETGTVRCLIEAPSAQAALDVHREAHGLMPDAITEVSEGR
jgi:hypothetical protein